MNTKEAKKISFGAPVLDHREIEAVTKVLQGTTLTHGPLVAEFEERFRALHEVEHAIAVSSCTAALHICMMKLNLLPGDEVIVPAQTHVATAHVVEFCGAKPVFADVRLEDGNIDISEVERLITPKTKAVTCVHFLGVPCAMEELSAICKKNGITLVEDCALAVSSSYKGRKTGGFGLGGCFSFYPIKHITTGEGGMLTTNDSEFADMASKLRAFGIDRSIVDRKVPGIYDVTYVGNNYRMTEIGAAIGLVQLEKFPGMLEKRSANAARLREVLSEVGCLRLFEEVPDTLETSHYCFSVMVPDESPISRDEAIERFNEEGVGTSIYYGTPVPLMGFYKEKYGYKNEDFPNATYVADRTISLPVGAHLDTEDMEYIGRVAEKIFS